MAIVDAIKKAMGRWAGVRTTGGIVPMSVPPGLNYSRYVEMYGEVGWLFGAVSLIATSVADSKWHLYQKKTDGDREEITKHPLVDLLNYVNPFQTRYQFMTLLQSYRSLVGEAFIILNLNGMREPGEMWLVSPGDMWVVPSANKYIDHYDYQVGGVVQRLENEQVIHILDANPSNPYRGKGAAQSIGVDLDSERYAARHQQRLFYNDGRPAMAVEFPDQNIPSKETREEVQLEWNTVHQGWRNAYKTAFLWGGAKINNISLSPKDMDFEKLRGLTPTIVAGAFHIPERLLHVTTTGSRAQAEADEYFFAKYCTKPQLTAIREALNEQLVGRFGDGLELDYDDPVPKNIELEGNQNRENFKAGLITLEEARTTIGLDPDMTDGETIYVPFNVMPQIVGEAPPEPEPEVLPPADNQTDEEDALESKSGRSLTPPLVILPSHPRAMSGWTDEQKEAHWNGYVAKATAQERLFQRALRTFWDDQEAEVIRNLKAKNEATFEEGRANEDCQKMMMPLIAGVFESALDDAMTGQKSITKQEGLLNERAWAWIKARSLMLAKMVNGTTKEQIRKALEEGFRNGESIDELVKRITAYYGQNYKVRAQMVARTETIAASAQGTLEGYQELGVQKVEFYCAIDERVCPECESLHNKVYPIIESLGVIPIHVQCRCVWLSGELD